ncbi:FAD-binding domain-containing protein [Thozetella sp. PMI_491]|nr:FAD-binding domain-containing protein [Thozetella sp. PMI_491]
MFSQRTLAQGLMLCMTLASTVSADAVCCNDLSVALGDDVFYPNGTNTTVGTTQVVSLYTSLNTGRWSNTAILSPSCIFRPTSAEHLSQAMQILTQGSCQFAVKSGGHMPIPGANNIDNGVSIDLQYLNQTVLSADKKTVHLGTGTKWINAYHAFADDGIGFTGGLCGTTGVGGVTLGGGQSIFSAQKGWAVDNIVNYEIVLASGEIVSANATTNSDLYKALKGGGPNFGIVTRVDIQTFEYDNKLWGGELVVPALPALAEVALSATTAYTTANNLVQDTALQTVFFYYANGNKVIDFAMASTDNVVSPAIFAPITALSAYAVENTLSSRTMPDLIEEIITTQPEGYRQLWATVTFKNDLATMEEVHNITNAIYAQVNGTVPDMDWVFFYSPQPKIIETFGENMLNLQDVDHDQMIVFITPRWLDAAYDSAMYAAAEQWVNEVTAVTQALGTDDPFLYLNFAAKFQKPLCAYGDKNIQFLKQVAAKYDPNSVFQTLMPGGFKLSQAC